MRWRPAILLALLIGVAASAGCASGGFTLLGVGAGTTDSNGVTHAPDSTAYKTFTASGDTLGAATLKTLERMGMKLDENQPTDSGRRILARAGDRTVEIDLERLTPKTTQMRVKVKQGWFFRDQATATEVVAQAERTLEEEPPTQNVRPPAKPAALKKSMAAKHHLPGLGYGAP